MVKDKTLYDTLEVNTDASTEDILKSYKKLALKYHPDKNPDNPEAENKFKDIQQAKEVLSNPEKRNMYDQVGMNYVNGSAGQQPDMSDIFNMFGGGGNGHPFGAGHPFGGGHREEKENITLNQEVTLDQLYNEETIQLDFKQKHACVKCNGEGTKDGNPCKCTICNGNGMISQRIQMGPMIQEIRQPCPSCRGSGKTQVAENKCIDCNGNCYKMKDVKIRIPLKNGLSNGQQIQLPGHGHNFKDGKTDLIIIINEKEHSSFKRNGNDLIININLTLYQSLNGFDKVVDHLDKRKLHLSHSGKTEFNTVRKICNEGMNILNTSNKGDLIIKFIVDLPNINWELENSQKLLYLLKSVDQTEVNNEVIIKNNKNKYIKTLLVDTEYDTTANNSQREQQQEQRHDPFRDQHHQQQCAHQ